MPERSRDWFQQAQHDLEKAKLDLQWQYFEWACFTAHQAAEKAVKAVYYARHGEARGTAFGNSYRGWACPSMRRCSDRPRLWTASIFRHVIQMGYPPGYHTITFLGMMPLRPSQLRRQSLPGVKITFLEIEPILTGLKERAQRLLASHPRVREVGLFGSLVRGNYGPGSDADLLVILETDARRFVDRIPEFLAQFSGLGIAVDVFPYTLGEIAEMQDVGFIKTALAERTVLASRDACAT